MAASQISWRRCLKSPLGRLQYCGFVSDLRGPAPGGSRLDDKGIRFAEQRDVPRLAALMSAPQYAGSHMNAEALLRRFDAGDRCLLAERDGSLAAISWIRFDNASFRRTWLSVPLKKGEAYFAWTHTEPSQRGRGFATRLALWRWRWLREQGIRVAYSWVRPTNDAMLTVTSRAGAVAVTWVTQYYPRVVHRPRLNFVRVPSTPSSLSDWCSPARMRFPQGLTFFRHATTSALQPPVERHTSIPTPRVV